MSEYTVGKPHIVLSKSMRQCPIAPVQIEAVSRGSVINGFGNNLLDNIGLLIVQRRLFPFPTAQCHLCM